MSREYQPIDCGLHDRLEDVAIRHASSRLRYRDANGSEIESDEVIDDVFARDGVEYVRTRSGLEIRLDDIVALDGVTFGGC